jgi:predicted phosphoribosyltransferase
MDPSREEDVMKTVSHLPGHNGRDLAGREMAEKLAALSLGQTVIVALSPESVDLAFDVAQRLGCELDLLLTGKIVAPGHPEKTIGMVIDLDVPQVVIDEDLAREFHLPPGYLNTECQHQLADLERRHVMYLGDADGPCHDHAGKHVVIIDHGIEASILQLVLQRLGEAGTHSVRVAQVASTGEPPDDRAVTQLLKQARRFQNLLH